jgi:iron complex outermembrane receptor protein
MSKSFRGLRGSHICQKGFKVLAVAATILCGAESLQAAESGEPAGAGADTLAEVVVTAQKHQERAQDVPISISTESAKDLEMKGVEQVGSLPQLIPAMRIDYSGNTVQPTIRGVGSQVSGPGLTSNVAVYVDGYLVPSPVATDIDLVNMQAVSVLKGPQGTLFGYNATGGAIQITTPAPEHETSGFVRVGYGSHNDANTAFYGTTGLGDLLAVSVAGSYDYGDGYITNIVNGDDKAGEYKVWSIRPKVLFTPTDDISFLLTYLHSYTDNPWPNDTIARNGETIGNIVPGNIIATDRGQISANAPNFVFLTTDSGTLTSTFKFPFADLISYSGYRSDGVQQGLEYDDTPANIYAAEWQIPDQTITQEFDLTSKANSRFQWVTGAFYMHYTDIYHYNTNNPATATGSPYVPVFTSKNTTDSLAGFADGTYQFTDNWFFTAGGRYSHDHECLAFNLYAADDIASGCTTFTNFSPRGVLRYKFDEESSAYLSFTEGYKAGALPGSAFSFTPVEPEKIHAFEVGYKLAAGKVHADIAAFYYNYMDIQVTAYGAGGTSITRNAADAHIYGLDGELTYQLTSAFTLNLAGTYTHARYTDFPNAIGFEQDRNPASPTYGQFDTVQIDATGFQVQRTPAFAGDLGGNYGFALGGGKLVTSGNLYYTSKFYFDAVEQLPQGGYALLNLRATWTDPSGRIDFSVFGNNVTSKKYFAANFTDTFASRAVYGAPALFGGSITYRF